MENTSKQTKRPVIILWIIVILFNLKKIVYRCLQPDEWMQDACWVGVRTIIFFQDSPSIQQNFKQAIHPTDSAGPQLTAYF